MKKVNHFLVFKRVEGSYAPVLELDTLNETEAHQKRYELSQKDKINNYHVETWTEIQK